MHEKYKTMKINKANFVTVAIVEWLIAFCFRDYKGIGIAGKLIQEQND